MDISFIIVNYRSEHFLKNCIYSIIKHAPSLSWELIIVNTDENVLVLDLRLNNMRIINLCKNVGFSNACNLGSAQAKGRVLFFLNPDTIIHSFDIKKLFEATLETNVGIVAPKLIGEDGNTQDWSSGFEINLWSLIKNNLGHINSKKIWNTDNGILEVDWVSGAAFLIKKSLFSKFNGFDEKFFLYFEDVDLCRRIRLNNYKILLMCDVKITHLSGKSSINNKLKKKQYFVSQDYYFKKHFGNIKSRIIKMLRIIFNRFSN